MANKMLIDAAHPEETRVVVVRGNRVEEFDFEAANRKQLRGNIYLAKVTRVEPSLQAAFVEYGGNRHGFLAFSEIHPDYYQIPVADRQALLDEEEAEAAAQEAPEAPVQEAKEVASDGEAVASSEGDDDAENVDQVESVGAEDALEEVPERKSRQRRQYKIQEVIKRRQVLLVQVVKEERGNKGAALTTYLSLAGRYSVLMPNTGRGGGISRKITQPADRKRLKKIASELDVPEGMGVILRTAGASRTKAEIKRDFEYLMRLWENVRELTLQSTAPCLVYEEGSLIKRSIRDLYNKDIDQVLVSGDDAYREAKDFMRMLMPSHAKNVQPYRDPSPLFTRSGVEPQLDAMFSPQVTLKSGGYIVIDQTEALVAIDVNSGKSTKEHNIEDTALQTNLEAAEEITRQLRLRDLAGLIVIDFIDMEENKNNRSVERKLKECLKNDRARIQVGRISHFGLLEMSRQRIRTGVLESSTTPCPHCNGTGMIRSVESIALHVLRSLEDTLLKGVSHNIIIKTETPIALYVLNQKRGHLAELEARFGLAIAVQADEMMPGHYYEFERGEAIDRDKIPAPVIVQPDTIEIEEVEEELVEEELPVAQEDGERKKRRRRKRRRPSEARAAEGNEDSVSEEASSNDEDAQDNAEDTAADTESAEQTTEDGSEPKRKRRRGRRGGRRSRKQSDQSSEETSSEEADAADDEGTSEVADASEAPVSAETAEAKSEASEASSPANENAPEEKASASASAATDTSSEDASDAKQTVEEVPAADGVSEEPITPAAVAAASEAVISSEPEATEVAPAEAAPVEVSAETSDAPAKAQASVEAPEEAEPEAPRRPVRTAPKTPVVTSETASPDDNGMGTMDEDEDGKPKRTGWWQRRSFF